MQILVRILVIDYNRKEFQFRGIFENVINISGVIWGMIRKVCYEISDELKLEINCANSLNKLSWWQEIDKLDMMIHRPHSNH